MSDLLIGSKIGRWTVKGVAEKRGKGAGYLVVPAVCDCGTERLVGVSNLKRGLSPSCGCISRERTFKHGLCSTPEYRAWRHMIERCENPHTVRFKNYGGRGISVCERWRQSFPNFLTDIGSRPSAKHSIERIDNNGNYQPGNCRWATNKEQALNKRTNQMIEFNGKSQPLTVWADELGINRSTLAKRLGRSGWTIERALLET